MASVFSVWNSWPFWPRAQPVYLTLRNSHKILTLWIQGNYSKLIKLTAFKYLQGKEIRSNLFSICFLCWCFYSYQTFMGVSSLQCQALNRKKIRTETYCLYKQFSDSVFVYDVLETWNPTTRNLVYIAYEEWFTSILPLK